MRHHPHTILPELLAKLLEIFGVTSSYTIECIRIGRGVISCKQRSVIWEFRAYTLYTKRPQKCVQHIPWKFSPTPGRSTICLTPAFSNTDFAPIPDRSRTCGEPKVPEDTTISFLARMTWTLSAFAFGWNLRLGVTSTPIARLFLGQVSLRAQSV